MEPLKLKHAEIYLDDDGWLRINKHNGEELALQLEPGDLQALVDTWRASRPRSASVAHNRLKSST
jgi:hypothetical protein